MGLATSQLDNAAMHMDAPRPLCGGYLGNDANAVYSDGRCLEQRAG
ncbi:MAG: hypothetical protein PHR16_01325 [Methylovulum sp.]|nr:hypothetical protein [Methylovulum sp.]